MVPSVARRARRGQSDKPRWGLSRFANGPARTPETHQENEKRYPRGLRPLQTPGTMGIMEQHRAVEELLVNVPDSPDAFEVFVARRLRSQDPDAALIFVGMLQNVPSSLQYLLTLAVSTMKRAFSEAPAKDPFSYALKKTNEALRQEMAANQNQVLGNFAATAAVLDGKSVRVSTAGSGKAVTIRDGLMQEIVARESAGQFFSAVAEGQLKPQDALILLPAQCISLSAPQLLVQAAGRKAFLAHAEQEGGGAAIVALTALPEHGASGNRAMAPLSMFRKLPQKTSAVLTVIARIPFFGHWGMVVERLPAFSHVSHGRLQALGALWQTRSARGRLVVGAVVATLAAAAVLFLAQPEGNRVGHETLGNAQTLFEQAEAALVLGEGERAHALVAQGLSLLDAAGKTQEQNTLRKDFTKLALELERTTAVGAEIVAQLPQFPVAFQQEHFAAFQEGDGSFVFFLADPAYAGLWRLSQDTKKEGRFVFFPEPIRSGVRSMTVVAAGTLIAASQEGLVELLVPQGTIRAAAPFSKPLVLTAFFTDGTTLYGVDPAQRQLFKIGLSGEITPLLRSPNDTLSRAIAGAVVENVTYVLLDDGSIARFRGIQELARLSTKTQSNTALEARRIASNGQRLFLLDSVRGRIARVSFSGALERQVQNEAIRGAKDFLLLENGGAALVLTDTQIVRIPLQ